MKKNVSDLIDALTWKKQPVPDVNGRRSPLVMVCLFKMQSAVRVEQRSHLLFSRRMNNNLVRSYSLILVVQNVLTYWIISTLYL